MTAWLAKIKSTDRYYCTDWCPAFGSCWSSVSLIIHFVRFILIRTLLLLFFILYCYFKFCFTKIYMFLQCSNETNEFLIWFDQTEKNHIWNIFYFSQVLKTRDWKSSACHRNSFRWSRGRFYFAQDFFNDTECPVLTKAIKITKSLTSEVINLIPRCLWWLEKLPWQVIWACDLWKCFKKNNDFNMKLRSDFIMPRNFA